MKVFKSDIFGDLPEPENFTEVLLLLCEREKEFSRCVHMWRGQSNIEWRLDHSAYRRLIQENKKVTDDSLIHYERSLLKQATHRGYRLQNGRQLSDFELLARLQHHGAATRLLDFTRNCLVALWFCVSANYDKPGLLIGLHCDYLGGYESEDISFDYDPYIKSIATIHHPQTWEPPVITPRIAAQHSQFIYSALSPDKRGSIYIAKENGACFLIAISSQLKRNIEQDLEQLFDLRAQTLFPDVDGFGQANSHLISENKMWRW